MTNWLKNLHSRVEFYPALLALTLSGILAHQMRQESQAEVSETEARQRLAISLNDMLDKIEKNDGVLHVHLGTNDIEELRTLIKENPSLISRRLEKFILYEMQDLSRNPDRIR